jgi:hypothetical protein
LRLSADAQACIDFGLSKVEVVRQSEKLVMTEPGKVGAGSRTGGGNSGFQALNLAAQFGAAKIIMVGFDMRVDYGVHWHGRHGERLNNPREANMPGWRSALDHAAAVLARYGVCVINASPVSTLTAYPKMTFAQALEC